MGCLAWLPEGSKDDVLERFNCKFLPRWHVAVFRARLCCHRWFENTRSSSYSRPALPHARLVFPVNIWWLRLNAAWFFLHWHFTLQFGDSKASKICSGCPKICFCHCYILVAGMLLSWRGKSLIPIVTCPCFICAPCLRERGIWKLNNPHNAILTFLENHLKTQHISINFFCKHAFSTGNVTFRPPRLSTCPTSNAIPAFLLSLRQSSGSGLARFHQPTLSSLLNGLKAVLGEL